MIIIYRNEASTGARDLAEGITLQGVLARRTRGQLLRQLTPNDVVVCWGSNFAATPGTRTLNNVPAISKFTEAQRLAEARVPCVQVSVTRPNVRAERPAFVEGVVNVNGGALTVAQANQLQETLTTFLALQRQRRVEYDRTPAIPVETWLARRNNHVGGSDLLTPTNNPDFWSKKEAITEEYRLHMFRGKSIRAGKKMHRTNLPAGQHPHAWIRSYNAGWFINYDGFESSKPMRDLAAKAVKALGLDFGAVDLGRKADGSYIVLEVNRAPGVEGGTVETYARHIIAWAQNPNQDNERER